MKDMAILLGAALLLLAGLAVLLSRSAPLIRRVEAWFKRAPKSPKPVRKDHYYRPYWQG